MQRKIIYYHPISGFTKERLEENVNNLLPNYQPFGNPYYVESFYHQAMVKYEEVKLEV